MDGVIVARVNGEATPSDLLEFQKTAMPDSQSERKVRVIVFLDNFEGWTADEEGWKESGPTDAIDQHLERLAIIGEDKWRDQVLLFTLAGMRPVDIRYFTPDQEETAEKWLTDN